MKITIIKIQYSCIIKIHSHNGSIISVQETKKILNDPTLSDKQAGEIRDSFRMLSEVVFDKWYDERKNKKEAIIN